MALKGSDFNLRNLWSGQYDPTNPKSLVMKLIGGIVALTFVLYAWAMANQRGLPLMNKLLNKVGLGAATPEGDVEVF